MLFVNHRARKSNKRGSSHGNFHPRCEGLEAKILLAIDLGGTSPGGSSADFARFIAEETEKWVRVVKFAGIKAD